MPHDAHPPLLLALPDGSKLGLNVARFDERQRRLRLRLPKAATCWDYAPLIDVTCREPNSDFHRFTGQSAAQWLADLRERQSPDLDRYRRWYEAIINRHLDTLARRPRVPVNHYCIELATPPLQSSLPRLIQGLGLKRASVAQWSATLRSLTSKGLSAEELDESGVPRRLQSLPPEATPTQAQVVAMVSLAHVTPKLSCESRFGFVAKAGWKECCQRIPAKEFKRRGLLGAGQDALHLVRFRHQSMGWSIVRTRYRDLITERTDWWGVLDEKGRFIRQHDYGFESPEDAMREANLESL